MDAASSRSIYLSALCRIRQQLNSSVDEPLHCSLCAVIDEPAASRQIGVTSCATKAQAAAAVSTACEWQAIGRRRSCT
jgi:hypothetical protein